MGEPVKRSAVIQLVRKRIGDGTLKPGASVSAAALARESGTSALTGRAALRQLLADGTLTQGASRYGRLKVAAPGASGAAVQASQAELSKALADLRHARGLTQPGLAVKLGVAVTTVGHAETGRTWQRPGFWHEADDLLGGGGSLVRLYDRYRAALVAEPGSGADSRPGPGPQPHSPDGGNPVRNDEPDTAGAGPLPDDADERLLSLLTPAEHAAVRDAGLLYTFIATHVTADGPTREDDLAELRAPIHVIQRMVLAQAAARAFPKEFRLLGGLIVTERTGEQRT